LDRGKADLAGKRPNPAPHPRVAAKARERQLTSFTFKVAWPAIHTTVYLDQSGGSG
jgi:hypothetical protein